MTRITIATNSDTMVAHSLRRRLVKQLREYDFEIDVVDNVEVVEESCDLLITDNISEEGIGKLRKLGVKAICLADPKLKSKSDVLTAKACDFALVGSFEHAKIASESGIETAIYPFLPDIEDIEPGVLTREKLSGLTLGYHGNRVHLETFSKRTLRVLDEAASDFDVRLVAHYRISRLGEWRPGKLRNIIIEHREWHPTQTFSNLRNVDVGLIPNSIPHRKPLSSKLPSKLSSPEIGFNKYGMRRDDYDSRFKITSNPGRIYPFGKLGTPVISDFFPSSAFLVRDGVDGFLCLSDDQWGWALHQFLSKPELIDSMGKSLLKRVYEKFDSPSATRALASRIRRLSDKQLSDS